MQIRRDRVVIVIAAFVLAAVAIAEPFGVVPPLGRTFATLLLIAVAGYAVGLSLVSDGITAGGRLVLTLGASLAIPVAVALVLSGTPFGIGRWQFLVGVGGVFALAVGIGLRRRRDVWRSAWSVPGLDARVAVAGVVYLAAFAGAVVAIEMRAEVASQPTADITELSIDPEALAEGRVVAHVISHEHRLVQFRIDVVVDGDPGRGRTETVRDGEEWVVEIPGVAPGDRVVVTLHREPDVGPAYRTVEVTVPGRTGSASP